MYFKVFDFVITGITDRFDQPGYTLYKSLEDLLVNAVNNAMNALKISHSFTKMI